VFYLVIIGRVLIKSFSLVTILLTTPITSKIRLVPILTSIISSRKLLK